MITMPSTKIKSFTVVHPHDALRSQERERWYYSENAAKVKALSYAAYTDVVVHYHNVRSDSMFDSLSDAADDRARETAAAERLNASIQFESVAGDLCKLLPSLVALRRLQDLRRTAAIAELLIEQASICAKVFKLPIDHDDVNGPVELMTRRHASPLLQSAFGEVRCSIEQKKEHIRQNIGLPDQTHADAKAIAHALADRLLNRASAEALRMSSATGVSLVEPADDAKRLGSYFNRRSSELCASLSETDDYALQRSYLHLNTTIEAQISIPPPTLLSTLQHLHRIYMSAPPLPMQLI